MNIKSVKYRLGKSAGFQILVYLLAFACVVPLLFILFYIIRAGITRINWHFLVNIPKPVGESGGGVANALVGSILIIAVASIIAIPIGIMAGSLSQRKQEEPARLLVPACYGRAPGRALDRNRYRCLFLAGQAFGWFFRHFGQPRLGYHDAAHHRTFDRRDVKAPARFPERSGPGLGYAVPPGHFQGHCSRGRQRHPLRGHVVHCPHHRRVPLLYCSRPLGTLICQST